MRTLLIIFIVLLVIGGISYFIYSNRTKSNKEWDKKCTESGGRVEKSGQTCDYSNCDRTRYSCWFPAN